MKNGSAFLIALFVSATVLADLVIQRTVSLPLWHDRMKGPALGFALGQVALLTLWLARGSGYPLGRLTITLTASLLLAWQSAAFTSGATEPHEWFGAMCLLCFAVASPLVLLERPSGWTRTRTSIMGDSCSGGVKSCCTARRQSLPMSQIPAGTRWPTAVGTGGWQISLGTVILWITGFSMTLGVLCGFGFPWKYPVQASLHCMGFAIVALCSIWLVFGRAPLAVRVPLVMIVSPTVGLLLGVLVDRASLLAVICTTEMVMVATGSAVLQYGGLIRA